MIPYILLSFAGGVALGFSICRDLVRQERGLRSNDVKNHDKKITCCFYLKKAETFLLLMFFNFSP